MTQEKRIIFAYGQLNAYCEDDVIIEPPCYKDNIYDIFDSYNHTGFSKNKETSLDRKSVV